MTSAEVIELAQRRCVALNVGDISVCEPISAGDKAAMGFCLLILVGAIDMCIFRAFNGRPIEPPRPRTVYDFSPRVPDPGCFEEMSNDN